MPEPLAEGDMDRPNPYSDSEFSDEREMSRQPEFMDNKPAVGAPENWKWGYLPCGCRNDGFGHHVGWYGK